MEPLEKLKNKIFNDKTQGGALTPLLALAQDFGCLENIVGAQYELNYSFWRWKITFKIKKKPWTFRQVNQLLKERDKFIKAQEAASKKGYKTPRGKRGR